MPDMIMVDPERIYAGQLRQACLRLKAALGFHRDYERAQEVPYLEAAVLQLRIVLELIAFAAMAPDQTKFAELRATDGAGDYTKDWHARRILATLDAVNPDFYPISLLEPVLSHEGVTHFERKSSDDYLNRNRFEKVYDRLGRHLHATNPWGNDGQVQNLARDVPRIIEQTYSLLDLHARIIHQPAFQGTWVVRVDRDGGLPQMLHAVANDDFVDTLRKK